MAAKIVRKGGVIVFPTETVYGIGASALNKKAVKKIFKIKNRPARKPLGLFVAQKSQLKLLVKEVPKVARKLIQKYWPGPLTLIFKDKQGKTIGIRMPDHPVILKILKMIKVPMVQTSANKSGQPAPQTVKEVIRQLGRQKINLILDGGPTKLGVASTVIDVTQKPPKILRKGALRKSLPQ